VAGAESATSEDAGRRAVSPRRPTTRWHFTQPGSWDRERIIGAICAWAEETGAPPFSYEWSPGSARSLGLIGPELTKWEREHPRWPGNSTVYRYFGSWPEALEAAGFEPRTRARDDTIEERVQRAIALSAAGKTNVEIAEILEVNPGTVARYLRAHPCAECAAPVVGSGQLCHVCATRAGNPRRWERDEILDAAREWSRLEGKPPTALDWRGVRAGGAPRWDEEFPRWPPSGAIKIHFGGWNRMLEEAGLDVNHPSWSAEEILAGLRRYRDEFGKVPSKTALEWPPKGVPSARTVRRHFGSFTAGIRAAGLEPVGARSWSDEEILEAIRHHRRAHGRAPRLSEWRRASAEHPSARSVARRFGGWPKALAAAGVSPPPRARGSRG
jgi:hypothetical protein